MTTLQKIIVLDCSCGQVFITTVEHHKENDLDVDVSDKLDELDKNIDECSWMSVDDDFLPEQIKSL